MPEPDVNMLRQIRLALDDIAAAFAVNRYGRAQYQVHRLRAMIDEQPSRRQPWSFYQQQVAEEFDDEP